MKASKMFGILAAVLFTVALAGAAFALPLTIDEVKVDGTELQPNQTNKLSIERNEQFDVKVTITGTAEQEHLILRAFISGYEHDFNGLSDVTGLFKVEANTTYTKKLKLSLPADIDEDSYKLRIEVSDRNSDSLIQNYNLKIDKKRHEIDVDDIVMYPQNTIQAGSALLTTVRVKNFGDKDEDDVRVKISIPALGLSATDYIDEVESDDVEETEELFLRIPRSTKAGDYELKVTVDFNDGYDTVEKSAVVHVEADEAYQESQMPKTVITVGSTLENVMPGESVIFPLTLGNAGTTDKAYSIAVAGASGWAEVRISPTTTQIVKSGESKAFYLSIGVDKDASAGPHVLTAKITSGNEQVEEVALTVNVAEKKGGFGAALGKILSIALIAVLGLLILFGIIAGVSRIKGREEYVSDSETYY